MAAVTQLRSLNLLQVALDDISATEWRRQLFHSL